MGRGAVAALEAGPHPQSAQGIRDAKCQPAFGLICLILLFWKSPRAAFIASVLRKFTLYSRFYFSTK